MDRFFKVALPLVLLVDIALAVMGIIHGNEWAGAAVVNQLLAHVLGAPVSRHVHHEIGWYDLKTTGEGRGDPRVRR